MLLIQATDTIVLARFTDHQISARAMSQSIPAVGFPLRRPVTSLLRTQPRHNRTKIVELPGG